MLASKDKNWEIQNWSDTIEVLEGIEVNVATLVAEA